MKMENIIKIIPYITLFYMNSLMLNRPISVIPHYSIKIFKNYLIKPKNMVYMILIFTSQKITLNIPKLVKNNSFLIHKDIITKCLEIIENQLKQEKFPLIQM